MPSTRLTHADAAKLTDLGHSCIICMTDFSEGEDSKMLPCMHVVSRPIKTLDGVHVSWRFLQKFIQRIRGSTNLESLIEISNA